MNGINDDLVCRLHDLATAPAPGPAPVFVAGLEAHLRSIGPKGRNQTNVRSLRRRLGVAGAGAAALAAGIAAVVGVSSHLAQPRVQLAGAIDTQVIGPDGRVGEAAPGAVVADGSIVRTGPSGETRAGGVVIGPDRAALVVGGRLHQVTTGDQTADQKDRRLASPGDDAARAAGLRLSARRLDGGQDQLRWSRFSGNGLYGYVILRSDGGNAPDSNRDAIAFTTDVVALLRSHQSGAVAYRVVAVDRQGRVLATTGIVTVGG